MAGTVVAVFRDYAQAQRAGQALLDSGVAFADISLVRKGAGGEHGAPEIDGHKPYEESLTRGFREVETHDIEEGYSPDREVAPRAAVGIVTGASLGAIVASAAIFVPGLGPLLAAGPLVAMLTGTIAGGAVGGLVGALTHDGIPEDAAQRYHDHVTRGDTLIAVLAGNQAETRIEETLRQQGGEEIAFFPRFIDTVQTIES